MSAIDSLGQFDIVTPLDDMCGVRVFKNLLRTFIHANNRGLSVHSKCYKGTFCEKNKKQKTLNKYQKTIEDSEILKLMNYLRTLPFLVYPIYTSGFIVFEYNRTGNEVTSLPIQFTYILTYPYLPTNKVCLF